MNNKKLQENMELIFVVLFPSLLAGITVATGLFAVLNWEIEVGNLTRYAITVVIASLISAIYFSIKATIYVIEQKQKKQNKVGKQIKKVTLDENPKLYRSMRVVS